MSIPRRILESARFFRVASRHWFEDAEDRSYLFTPYPYPPVKRGMEALWAVAPRHFEQLEMFA